MGLDPCLVLKPCSRAPCTTHVHLPRPAHPQQLLALQPQFPPFPAIPQTRAPAWTRHPSPPPCPTSCQVLSTVSWHSFSRPGLILAALTGTTALPPITHPQGPNPPCDTPIHGPPGPWPMSSGSERGRCPNLGFPMSSLELMGKGVGPGLQVGAGVPQKGNAHKRMPRGTELSTA